MKRLVVCLSLIFVFLVAIPLMAQELPLGDSRNADFRAHFVKVKALNTNVKDFMKMPVGAEYNLPDGKTDALGFDDFNGIWGREFQKVYRVSYDEFLRTREVPKPVTTPALNSARAREVQPEKVETPAKASFPWFWLVIIALLAVAVALYFLLDWWKVSRANKAREATEEAEQRRRETERVVDRKREATKRLEPEQLGTPVVAGGIPPTETERLQNFFEQQAVNSYVARHPELAGNRNSVRPTLVGQIEHGMLSGEGQVRDLDGTWHDSIINAPGRPGYQARFRYPDGTEELMQSYQACMNPVRSGQGMRGYTFVPDTTTVATPEPPVTEPVRPEPEPVVAEPPATPTVPAVIEPPAPVAEPAPAEPGVKTFEYRRATNGKPAMVRLSGIEAEEFSFTVGPDGTTLRYREVEEKEEKVNS